MCSALVAGVAIWAAATGGPDDVQPQGEIDEAVAQATLNPLPPLGGAREFGAAPEEQVPLGALTPRHQATDVTLRGLGFGDLTLSRSYSGTPAMWGPAKAAPKLGSPFGHVEDWDSPAEAPALQWTHGLHSYVLVREETRCEGLGEDRFCNDVTYWNVHGGPAGLKKSFTACEGTGCFAFSRSEQDLRLQWDGAGFVAHTPQGRFHYRSFRELSGVFENGSAIDERTTWPAVYFLSYVESPQYDESACAASGVEDAGSDLVASCHRRTVRLQYEVPSECAATPGTTVGSNLPLLRSAIAATGAKLVFHYQRLPTDVSTLLAGATHECVLASVELVGRDGVTEQDPVVSYSYTGGKAGLLSAAVWPGDVGSGVPDTRLDYAYRDGTGQRIWQVERDGVLVTRQVQDEDKGHVLSEVTPHRANTVTAENSAVTPDAGAVPYCPPGTFGSNAPSSGCKPSQVQSFREFAPTVGDGTGDQVLAVDHDFDMALAGLGPYGDQGPSLRSSSVTCASSGCTALPPGGVESEWRWGSLPVVTDSRLWVDVAKSERQPNGAYTVYQHALPSQEWRPDAGMTPSYLPPAELRQVALGAGDADGGSPLTQREYTYRYGGSGRPAGQRGYEQLVESESSPSTFTEVPGLTSQTLRQYDSATNRLTAVVRSGWTWEFDPGTNGWQRVQRHFKTFYSTSNFCGVPAADPKGRVRAIIGPCRVAGVGSTSCDVTTSLGSNPANVPVSEFEYWADSETSDKAGRIRFKRAYPTSTTAGCGAYSLVTQFDDYDARGRLLQQTEANGTVTKFVYAGGRLVQRIDALGHSSQEGITEYGYDDNATHGDYIKDPVGRYEVLCYRTGTTAGQGCRGGTRTDLLQWKATSGTADGATYSERVDYTYYRGALASETYRNGSGQVRRTRYFEGDPLGRTTFESWGATAPGASSANRYSQTGLFDGQGNQVGLGAPYQPDAATPAPLCGGFDATVFGSSGVLQPQSPHCKALAYDKLNRLVGLLEPVDTSSSSGEAVQACMTYDTVGNLKSVRQGCPRGARSGDCSLCSQPTVEYQHDDFGNLVRMTAPWTDGGARQFQYDAAGNLVRKQTPTMATGSTPSWVEYTYDALGRMREGESVNSASVRQTLYSYRYDAEIASPPFNCPGYAPSRPARALGRTQVVTDSFGDTWFEYDVRGRVVGKWRVRAVSGSTPRTGLCANAGDPNRPGQGFYYDKAGRLLSEMYPSGRGILYNYYTAPALSHRLQSITVVFRLAEGLTEGKTIIEDIQWAPYGGVDSYVLVTPKAASGSNKARVAFHGDGSNAPLALCSGTGFTGGSDTSGRDFGLTVSTHEGSVLGNIFKRAYTWKADQLVREDSCLLETGSVAPSTVHYANEATSGAGYDARSQLRHAYRASTVGAAEGGSFRSRGYQYDSRGNRTSETADGAEFVHAYAAGGSRVDLLTSRSLDAKPCGGGTCAPDFTVTQRYGYDADGRVVEVSGYKTEGDSVSSPFYQLTLDAALDAAHAAEGAVYRQVTDSEGRSYEYFYDALGRRRLKRYAVATSAGPLEDEFFYDGTKLLEDWGNTTLDSSTARSVRDEYLWLDGRPVALFKARRDDTGHLIEDFVGDCPRNGESAPCGLYFIVADRQGKPVLMLDSWRRVTGVGDYEPSGHVNRTTLVADRPSSLALGTSGPMALLKAPVSSATTTWLRARLSILDVEGSSAVYLANASGTQVTSVSGGSTLMDGTTAYMATTPWAQAQSDGTLQLYFRMPATRDPLHDAALASVEYRRFQTGAVPVWTPLRFPGQYHDTETDLFENWNRFYMPETGRYSAPEPMYISSKWLRSEVGSGRSPVAYVYAGNNSVMFSDPDGQVIKGFDDLPGELQQTMNAMRESAAGLAVWNALEQSDTVFVLSESSANKNAGSTLAMRPVLGSQPVGPDTVQVKFNLARFPKTGLLRSVFGSGKDSYFVHNATPLHTVAHELAGHSMKYVGPRSGWPAAIDPEKEVEAWMANELSAEEEAVKISGLRVNPPYPRPRPKP